jgi:putative Mg2+ transporter-C (MgtC) family protein
MPGGLEIAARLLLSCVLGGLVGIERERNKRPAGFRTHILVCIGSALVMLSNLYIFEKYRHVANIDPARLGAQVISGIGFLGAGTILKEGVTVKGLTTAASLWAVAGIGLAIGIGFYFGAVAATVFVLITLVVFSRFESFMTGGKRYTILKIKTLDRPGQIGKIGTELGNSSIQIEDISMEPLDDNVILVKVRVNRAKYDFGSELMDSLSKIDGILYVEVCD